MGLINLKTNLKDLKFGHDRYKNGNSGEPFIQTRIPATDEPLQTSISISGNNVVEGLGFALLGAGGGALIGGSTGAIVGASLGVATAIATQGLELQLQTPTAGTGGPDFLLRGGYLASTATINDAIRLSKFFRTTEGVLFTVKQNLLSRIAVKAQGAPSLLNERLYTPLSSVLGAVGSSFGLHVNKQGLNPFLGLGEAFVPDRYLTAIENEINSGNPTNNRLIDLYGAKLLRKTNSRTPNPIFLKNNISSDPYTLLSYEGGPGAPLGIGKTNIRLASNPLALYNPQSAIYDSKINYLTFGYRDLNTYAYKSFGGTIDLSLISSFSDQLFSTSRDQIVINTQDVNVGSNEDPVDLGNPRSVKNYIPTSFQNDFRKQLVDIIKFSSPSLQSTILSQGPSYDPADNQTIEQRVNLGDPGNALGKNVLSYTNGANGDGAASFNSYDKINALPLYSSDSVLNDKVVNDLVKFRIGVINSSDPSKKTYIHFRAFLDQISDSYNSNWDPVKYLGRGENFYTYSGFDRKVSLGWTVAAQSKVELIPMYKKLNYLASVCAPDYSSEGYMRGNIITLTIGGYFYEQPGIITGFSYEMNEENDSWEIGINDEIYGGENGADSSVKELPHIIRVKGFNFIPIHTFVPRLQQNTYLEDPNTINSLNVLKDFNGYGAERYIALTSVTSNYNRTAPIETLAPLGIKPIPLGPISAEPIKGIGFISGEDIVSNTSNTFA
jgi:hypothetical protein